MTHYQNSKPMTSLYLPTLKNRSHSLALARQIIEAFELEKSLVLTPDPPQHVPWSSALFEVNLSLKSLEIYYSYQIKRAIYILDQNHLSIAKCLQLITLTTALSKGLHCEVQVILLPIFKPLNFYQQKLVSLLQQAELANLLTFYNLKSMKIPMLSKPIESSTATTVCLTKDKVIELNQMQARDLAYFPFQKSSVTAEDLRHLREIIDLQLVFDFAALPKAGKYHFESMDPIDVLNFVFELKDHEKLFEIEGPVPEYIHICKSDHDWRSLWHSHMPKLIGLKSVRPLTSTE